MDSATLVEILRKHRHFIERHPGGERADLRNVVLRGVKLP